MIRLIAGSLRGRKLAVPPESITRPTTDRVRETIFSTLTSLLMQEGKSFDELSVLDAFAGSGALGFEALSRGAPTVTFFEKHPKALKVLKENREMLSFSDPKVKIQRVDALNPPKTEMPAGLIFLDPPYNKGFLKPTLESLEAKGWVDDKTYLIYECPLEEKPVDLKSFSILKDKNLGSIRFYALKKSII